ncbi:MAG TPA: hypothetical protein VNB24_04215 [Acidimicrobiales bacterium]|nr:hypothetical protein [Acidimicrobiales bacterium]
MFEPGTRVEVRQRFDGRWARGFIVDSQDTDGYRLRRPSDDTILPVAFPPEDLREERKRQGMWWA